MIKRILAVMLVLGMISGCSGEVTEHKENKPVTEVEEITKEEVVVEEKEPEEIIMENEGKFSGKIICVDPGHGKTSRKETEPIYPGAKEKKAANVSGTAGKTITEEALNLQIGLKLKEALEVEGATVYITRTTAESDISNVERAEFANEKACDIVVRIHADGSESSSVSGISMLIPSEKRIIEGYLTEEIVEKSRKAGEYILNDVCENTGAGNNGMVERADMTGFNWSAVPVVLLEVGFLTNPEEEALLVTGEYQEKIITGIMTGLEKYFNE